MNHHINRSIKSGDLLKTKLMTTVCHVSEITHGWVNKQAIVCIPYSPKGVCAALLGKMDFSPCLLACSSTIVSYSFHHFIVRSHPVANLGVHIHLHVCFYLYTTNYNERTSRLLESL